MGFTGGRYGDLLIDRCTYIGGGIAVAANIYLSSVVINIKRWELANLIGPTDDDSYGPSSSEQLWTPQPLAIDGGIKIEAKAGGNVGSINLFNVNRIANTAGKPAIVVQAINYDVSP